MWSEGSAGVAVLFFWICGGEDVRHVYFMLGRI
jgi:hypothetical protein